MTAYYNENDKFAAQWLRNLVAAGLLPPGDVDERSILDVRADDLRGYRQCHFFAGIAGWPYALQLAGWPTDRAVWTGSAPCQPFSAAGSQDGAADERHLWPAWFALIRECRPEYIFGEQVSAAIRLGWLDGVFTDLEREGYTTGAAVLGAHSINAPHIRQRLYWVGHADRTGREARDGKPIGDEARPEQPADTGADWVAQSTDERHERGGGTRRGRQGLTDDGATEWLADGNGGRRKQRDAQEWGLPEPHPNGATEWVADAEHATAERHGRHCGQGVSHEEPGGHPEGGPWGDSGVIRCGDGKRRRIPLEPALQPLAPGLPGRVGLLRGSGNAIVPPLAAEFIRAFLEVLRWKK